MAAVGGNGSDKISLVEGCSAGFEKSLLRRVLGSGRIAPVIPPVGCGACAVPLIRLMHGTGDRVQVQGTEHEGSVCSENSAVLVLCR